MIKGKHYTKEDYIITKNGEVINKHNNHISKPQLNGKGYYRVYIGSKLYFVHRLVAEKYIPNPDKKIQVNHKDGNKLNNCVDNLEWVTNQENRNHAVENNLHLKGSKCPYAKLNENDIIYGKFNHYTLIKDTFAYIGELYNDLENYDEIHIFGFVTDICVISNALKLRSELPKSKIIVHSDLCAGTTPENHEAALKVMKSCLIDII